MQVGDIVNIKECHKIPELVGKEAKVVAVVDPELAKYPVSVMLTDGMPGIMGFREEELEPAITEMPDFMNGVKVD